MGRFTRLAPHVGDASSLLAFASAAVLRDPLLSGATRMEPDRSSAQPSLSEQLDISAPTLRARVYGPFDRSKVEELEPFFKELERLKYPDGGGRLWFFARRLFGTDDDEVNDRIHAEWWQELRHATRFRASFDIVLSAEAAIAWLRTQPGGAPGLGAVDRAGILRVIDRLGILLGGGRGYATQAIDRLATLVRLAWHADAEFGRQILSRIAVIVETDPGGNSALLALDRCVRAVAATDSASGEGLIDAVSEVAERVLVRGESRADLWVPDVYGVRLARVLVHRSPESASATWLRWVHDLALAAGVVDVGTRRACVWMLAEGLCAIGGRRRWSDLRRQLGRDPEFADIFDAVDTAEVAELRERGIAGETARGWIDLVAVQFSVELCPPGWLPRGSGATPTWLVKGPVASLLSRHLPDDIAGLPVIENRTDGWAAIYRAIDHGPGDCRVRWPWCLAQSQVADATRDLLREAFTTPSAIRVRTVNETLDASGPVVRAVALAVTTAVLQELMDASRETYPMWFRQRVVHLAAIRGAPDTVPVAPLVEWQQRCRERLLGGCLLAAADTGLEAHVRGRAMWSVGDLIDKEYPPRQSVDDILRWATDDDAPTPLRVSAFRALGLLHRQSYQDLLEAQQTRVRHVSERRMLQWALRWYATEASLL